MIAKSHLASDRLRAVFISLTSGSPLMLSSANPIFRICRMLHDAYQHLAAIEYCHANRHEPTEGLLKDISAWLADYDENASESDSVIAKLEELFHED